MTELDNLHEAAELYAVSQGRHAPAVKKIAIDTTLKSAAIAYASAEGYFVPPILTDYDSRLCAEWAARVPNPTYDAQQIVTSLAGLNTKLASLSPGDNILVQGVTIDQQLNITNKLSSWAKITFDHNCNFVGYTGSTWIAHANLYFPDVSYLHVVFEPGCRMSNAKGDNTISIFAGHHIIMDGFVAGNNGGGGFHASPVNGDLSYLWARGEVSDLGHNAAGFDPHTEKGSGIHAVYCGNGRGGKQHDCFIAIFSHDSILCGGELELGSDPSAVHGQIPSENMVVMGKFERLHFKSLIQTGANGIQVWGAAGKNIVVPYVEVHDIFGKAVWCHNLSDIYKGVSYLNDIKVMAGLATNYCQNPRWVGQSPWDKHRGVAYPVPVNLSPRP